MLLIVYIKIYQQLTELFDVYYYTKALLFTPPGFRTTSAYSSVPSTFGISFLGRIAEITPLEPSFMLLIFSH